MVHYILFFTLQETPLYANDHPVCIKCDKITTIFKSQLACFLYIAHGQIHLPLAHFIRLFRLNYNSVIGIRSVNNSSCCLLSIYNLHRGLSP